MKKYTFFLLIFFIGTALITEIKAQRISVPTAISISGGNTYCQNAGASDITGSITIGNPCGNGANQTIAYTLTLYSNTTNSTTGGTQVASGNSSPLSYAPSTADCGAVYYYAEVSWNTDGCQSAGSLTSSTTAVTVECPCSVDPEDCIVINEFSYDPKDGSNGSQYNTGEWIEMYNKCDGDIDIGCWILCATDESSGARRGDCFRIPSGTVLAAGDVFVFGSSSGTTCGTCDFSGYSVDLDWHNCGGCATDVDGDGSGYVGVLADGGEDLTLFNSSGILVDGVTYEGGTGVSYSETVTVGASGGCASIDVTIPPSSNHTDLGGHSNSNDSGFGLTCDGTWEERSGDGTSGTYTFGTSENCPLLPLPVELLYFEVKYKNEKPLLTWATASETNNSHFEIEKSTEGQIFEYIGTVRGAGNPSIQRNYFFTDHTTPNKSIIYYRLKQVDKDGNYIYSDILPLAAGQEKFFISAIQVSNKNVKIQIHALQNSLLQLGITDITGQQLYYLNKNITKGRNDFTYSLANAAPGIYFLKISGGHQILTKKIILY